MNNDLISREALIKDGNNTRVWVTGWNENPSLAHQVLKEQGATFKKLVLEAPAVDAVEVVRCKDCKWYQEGKLLAPNKFCFRLKHPKEDRKIGYNYAPDDFCSYGERRAAQ